MSDFVAGMVGDEGSGNRNVKGNQITARQITVRKSIVNLRAVISAALTYVR